MTGENSQISTLCHEISHFARTGEGGVNGGMGTGDLNASGKEVFLSEDGHKIASIQMVNKHGESVFHCTYNIEKYFENLLDANTLSQVSKAVEEDLKKD